MTDKRSSFSSKLSFILVTAGAAIGLGNIQRFPYITAKCGGGAFLLMYLLCVLLIGLPLILVEFSIGRAAQKNSVTALNTLSPRGAWGLLGFSSILTAFFILCYYLVPSAWTLGYGVMSLFNKTMPLEEFNQHPYRGVVLSFLFMLWTAYIVNNGLQKGLERWSKILLPALFILLLVMIVYAAQLPHSWEGMLYYLKPDFSKVTSEVMLLALSQAFFSLCIGEAVLITFGSFVPKTDNLLASACSIVFFGFLAALLSGLVIFPAIFSLGQNPQGDYGMIYDVIPQAFQAFAFGSVISCAFFLLLAFAALTTCIALLEMPVNYLVESRGMRRSRAVFLCASLAFVLSVPIALSKGAHAGLSALRFPVLGGLPLLEFCDFIFGSVAMLMNGLLLCLFTGWVWGATASLKELSLGCPSFALLGRGWGFYLRYLAPLLIVLVLGSLFF